MAQRRGQWVLALLGMAAGVAVMSGVWLMQQALIGSIERATDTLAGEPTLSVLPHQGHLDEAFYRTWALQPQAPELYPIIEQPVSIDGRSMTVIGIDPLMGLGPASALAGNPVAGQLVGTRQVVVSAQTAAELGVGVDDSVELEHANRRVSLQVAAVVEAGPGLDDILVVDIATAQEQFGMVGVLSRIDAPLTAQAWLQAQPNLGWSIKTSDQQRASAAQLSRGMRTNLAAMSVLALAVGLLVVYAVLSFLLVQRRATIALMRAVGVERRHIVAQLLGEVSLLSVLGGGLGLIMGTELANGLLALVSQPFDAIYQHTSANRVEPSWSVYAVIWVGSMVMAWLSVAGVLIEAFRIPPGQLARQHQRTAGQRVSWVRWAMVPAALGVALIVAASQLIQALVGLFLVLAACAVWVPQVAFALLDRGRHALGRGLLYRAWTMLLSARARLAPALSALSLALALSAGVGMMVLGFRGAVDDWVSRLLQADVYLTASQDAITPDIKNALADLPGVVAISTTRQVDTPAPFSVIAYDVPAPAWAGFDWIAQSVLADSAGSHRRAFDAGDGVLVSQPLANKYDWVVGQSLSLQTPQGTHAFPILGIYRDYASERGTLAISAALHNRLWADANFDSLGLYTDGVDVAVIDRRVSAWLEAYQLTTPDEIQTQTLAVFDQTFRISWALAWLVGMIASIALISALLAMGIERGREYATLRAVGLTQAQLSLLVVLQTLGVAVLAALMALPLSVIIHTVLSVVIQPLAFGWEIPWSLPLAPWAMTATIAVLVGVLAGVYPARVMATKPPARWLRQLS